MHLWVHAFTNAYHETTKISQPALQMEDCDYYHFILANLLFKPPIKTLAGNVVDMSLTCINVGQIL